MVVGANAVVICDRPDNSIAVGIAAVIKRKRLRAT
jgi:acetyltransferase-like isoleucine patch superfamily enzyme